MCVRVFVVVVLLRILRRHRHLRRSLEMYVRFNSCISYLQFELDGRERTQVYQGLPLIYSSLSFRSRSRTAKPARKTIEPMKIESGQIRQHQNDSSEPPLPAPAVRLTMKSKRERERWVCGENDDEIHAFILHGIAHILSDKPKASDVTLSCPQVATSTRGSASNDRKLLMILTFSRHCRNGCNRCNDSNVLKNESECVIRSFS